MLSAFFGLDGVQLAGQLRLLSGGRFLVHGTRRGGHHRCYRLSYEPWLISRNEDASKKISCGNMDFSV